MILFNSDYEEGCCPEILRKLQDTNMVQTAGYGTDEYCREAADTIRRLCGNPDAHVHFLVGGTQTNATVISSVLRPYQGAMCAVSGHIAVHETGAIEHSGHKVITLEAEDGKVSADTIRRTLEEHFSDGGREHCVQPGLLYISQPTELGTLYSKDELTSLKAVCREYDIPLYVDGARLGYALASPQCDVSLKDLSSIADIFYIGGTKQGTLFGEALVVNDESLDRDFRYNIKQGGGMLAKGRLLGLQFSTVFASEDGSRCDDIRDTWYFKSSVKADILAGRIRKAFLDAGCTFLVDSPTNQQFPILPVEMASALSEKFVFEVRRKPDQDHVEVRFCTSWATKEENVAALVAATARWTGNSPIDRQQPD
ncbi:MAG: beta-eliminating lyase-related protein [Bacteroidales bacterium]|nr:beta-eliminating lyase-related protein [Bacteroidales bacterium]